MQKSLNDTLFIEQSEPPQAKSIKIETPLGSIESDSGSHIVDAVTVVCVIFVLYMGKKMIDKYFRKD
ncbi:hypothetical protein CMI37_22035 [Candidatus Pacearchaeota archaeon]|nr:hypothetical protein [Candidatus Pacearchaeota archaeon]|tara:strand:+ start:2929 stop:3129 length:201 start_codon:yes stop_codon:yes gene_type:complete